MGYGPALCRHTFAVKCVFSWLRTGGQPGPRNEVYWQCWDFPRLQQAVFGAAGRRNAHPRQRRHTSLCRTTISRNSYPPELATHRLQSLRDSRDAHALNHSYVAASLNRPVPGRLAPRRHDTRRSCRLIINTATKGVTGGARFSTSAVAVEYKIPCLRRSIRPAR